MRAIRNETERPTDTTRMRRQEVARQVAFARGAEASSSPSRWARSSLEPPTS